MNLPFFKGPRYRVNALEMYSSMFYDALTKGKRHNPQQLGADRVQLGYDRIFTGQCTKCYYFIKALPNEIPMSLLEAWRNYALLPLVRINYNMNLSRFYIDWNSTAMKDNRAVWERRLQESADTDGDFLSTNEAARKSERESWLIKSWNFVAKADRDGKALVKMDLIVEISTINNSLKAAEAFESCCQRFENYASMFNIVVKKSKGMMLDFLQYTSPLASLGESVSAGTIPNRVLIDEIVANLTSYTPGKLSEVGAILGLDVNTNMVVYMDVSQIMKRSLNIMLAAETSGGKSFMAKCLVREFLAQGLNCIILDRDGEYRPLTRMVNGVTIDLGRSSGRYFDSMQIGQLTGSSEVDTELYTESISATTSVFNALIDMDTGMDHRERKIFQDAYNIVLAEAGVLKEQPTTWKNSEKLRYHDIYKVIVRLAKHSGYIATYGSALSEFVDKLSVYFESTGLRSHMFQKKISINDILENTKRNQAMMLDIVLYLDKDTDQTKDGRVEQGIKFITASYLTILLTNYFKSIGEGSAVLVEEYQRYLGNAGMQSLVLNIITGNRKRNSATLLITNSPQTVVTSSEATMQALTDNIKNLIIGSIASQRTREALCSAWNIPYCLDTLMRISDDRTFEKCFMVRLENQEIAVVKQFLDPDDAASPAFSTSDDDKR